MEDLFHFKEKFDGYVFIDREGNESQCLVEYAPYQKVPNPLKKLKKPDGKINTIDDDTDFTAFKEDYEKEEHPTLDTPETFLEAIEKKEKEKEKETSLLQAIKEKKAEKQRLRQEKFDARKKREEERRKVKDDEKKKRKESQKAEIHAKNHAGKKAGGSGEKFPKAKRAGEMGTSQDETSHPASASVETNNKRSKKFDQAEEKTKGKKEEPKEVKPKERKYTDEEYEKIKLERKEKREQRERERQEKKLVKNKERPERQIYRPGMGRFSSQSISTSKEGETNETVAEKEYESKESTPDPSQGVGQPGKKYSRGKSWRNSKQQQQQQQSTSSSSSSSAPPKNESESKVYLTREFRRTSNGQVQKSEKVKGVKKEAEVKQPQQDAAELPKKSGKSYANKRKERQQKKEMRSKDSNVEQDAILDLPSD